MALTHDATAGKIALLGWADADWIGCLDTIHLRLRFDTYGGVVCWESCCQSTVALSMTQAELLASTGRGKKAVCLRQLLADFKRGPADGEYVAILNDDSGAIQLAKHQYGSKLNKAFDMRAEWIRDHQDAKIIVLGYVSTNGNRADLLTNDRGTKPATEAITGTKMSRMRRFNT